MPRNHSRGGFAAEGIRIPFSNQRKPGQVDDGTGTTPTVLPDGNSVEAAPTVVPKLSLATGLIYTYTKSADPSDPWYWTALDYRTGATVWKQLSGTGLGFNNNYAGIALGPDRAAYLGTLGGLVSMRDGG
ncbi:hypothetical protein [Nocardia araoensis]|uniref:hypothetical protein n=1 Tax=Nocardia araoensis TaxID=228600 RepID=UPI0002F81746|nr:hypothetical protein [Nocardia araoensis]